MKPRCSFPPKWSASRRSLSWMPRYAEHTSHTRSFCCWYEEAGIELRYSCSATAFFLRRSSICKTVWNSRETELEWEMRAALTDFVLSRTLSPPLSLKLYKILISTCCNKKIMIKSKSLMDEYENRILSQLLVLFFFTPIVFYVRVSDYRQIVWVFEGSDYRMVQTHTGHHRHAVSIMPICLIQSAWTYTDVLQLVRGILCTGPLG